VYVIFLLIYFLSFPPVAGTENPYRARAIGETHRQNTFTDSPKTEKTVFILTVCQILSDHTIRIGKGVLGELKRHAVTMLILKILLRIPIERGIWHNEKLPERPTLGNTIVWLFVLLVRLAMKWRAGASHEPAAVVGADDPPRDRRHGGNRMGPLASAAEIDWDSLPEISVPKYLAVVREVNTMSDQSGVVFRNYLNI
jgi:hypothetical protein